MASVSKVTVQELYNTATSQDDAIQGADKELQNLQSHCDTLASVWTGQAASTYHEAMNSFQDGAKQVVAKLKEMQQTMLETAKLYGATNENIISVAGKARSHTSGLGI